MQIRHEKLKCNHVKYLLGVIDKQQWTKRPQVCVCWQININICNYIDYLEPLIKFISASLNVLIFFAASLNRRMFPSVMFSAYVTETIFFVPFAAIIYLFSLLSHITADQIFCIFSSVLEVDTFINLGTQCLMIVDLIILSNCQFSIIVIINVNS